MADKVKVAPVGKYPERPLSEAQMSEEEIKEAEGRSTVDQIEDYHETHPTLERPKTVEKALDKALEERES